MSQPVEITRYPNRRLYDRSRKQYVTIGDIEAMILDGQDIRVRESKSDEDLTRLILTQIILERHPDRMKMFPVAFLHAMLRADRMAIDWLTVYFGQATSFIDTVKSTPGAKLVPGMNFWQTLLPGSGNSESQSSEPQASVKPTGQDNDPDAEQEMAAKLADMERRLKQLEGDSAPEGQ